jgi:OPA family glycerol-3-phosphate transporter-like MFS transporter
MTPDSNQPIPSLSTKPLAAALSKEARLGDLKALRAGFQPGFRPRRGLNWFAIGLLYTSFYMCRYNRPIADKLIQDEFHYNQKQIGLIISATTLVYAFGQIVNGLLTDKMGGKRAMLIGAIGTIVANVLFGAASYIGLLWLFVAIWGLNGYVQSFGAPGMVKMNAAWFSKRERGTFAGIFGFMINLGRFGIGKLGPALLGGFTILAMVHVPKLHWRWLFWAPSIICTIAALFMLMVVAETPEQAGYDYVGSRESADDSGTTADYLVVLTKILSNPLIWFTGAAYACTGVVRSSIDNWWPNYIQTVHGISLNSWQCQLLFFAIPFVASCGSLASGVISDRFFHSRRAPVAGALYLVETFIVLVAAQFHGLTAAVVFLSMISLTANSTHSLLGTAQAMDIGGRKMTGFASGVIDSFQYFGSSLAGYALGAAIDQWGWGTYFYFMAPFGVIGAILMFFSPTKPAVRPQTAPRPEDHRLPGRAD